MSFNFSAISWFFTLLWSQLTLILTTIAPTTAPAEKKGSWHKNSRDKNLYHFRFPIFCFFKLIPSLSLVLDGVFFFFIMTCIRFIWNDWYISCSFFIWMLWLRRYSQRTYICTTNMYIYSLIQQRLQGKKNRAKVRKSGKMGKMAWSICKFDLGLFILLHRINSIERDTWRFCYSMLIHTHIHTYYCHLNRQKPYTCFVFVSFF